MITRLLIENYALIHRLEVDFSDGLSIITGETGAGKSILIGALSLVLGERADSSVITDKSKKCIAEAVFSVGAYDLDEFFTEHDLDWDKYTILRRELTTTGKSRAFINDTPVSLSQLKELGERLVNNGIKTKQIRYKAICLHLDHARGYKTQESLDRNLAIRAKVKKENLKWTEFGIKKG